jgi:hypothetical protein
LVASKWSKFDHALRLLVLDRNLLNPLDALGQVLVLVEVPCHLRYHDGGLGRHDALHDFCILVVDSDLVLLAPEVVKLPRSLKCSLVNQIFIGIFHLQLAWAIVLTQLLVFMA